MDIKQFIKKFFGGNDIPPNRVPTEIPRHRISSEPAKVLVPDTLDAKWRFLNPRYPREWLQIIEKGVVVNPILSQTHNLLIALGNSGHTVTVQGPDAEKAQEDLKELAFFLNTDHLINELIAQINIAGAISAEIVVDPNLKGVEKIALVPAWSIWFDYNFKTDEYEPYQWLGILDPVKLNTFTYKYIPLLTFDSSPYAIPPFLGALSTLDITEELLTELRGLAKKMGLLGFLDVKFPNLPKAPNETEVEYQNRQKQFLQNVAQDIANNMTQGIFLHFEGTEAEFKELTSGGAGAGTGLTEILSIVERWTIEGAKAQPAVLGFATGYTETWSTVALHIFVNQIQATQNIVKRFLEYTYKLHLLLRGYNITDVDITFKPLPNFQPQTAAQARLFDAQAVVQLLQAGVINIDEARKQLGLEANGA
jgi:hypothetical protein